MLCTKHVVAALNINVQLFEVLKCFMDDMNSATSENTSFAPHNAKVAIGASFK